MTGTALSNLLGVLAGGAAGAEVVVVGVARVADAAFSGGGELELLLAGGAAGADAPTAGCEDLARVSL